MIEVIHKKLNYENNIKLINAESARTVRTLAWTYEARTVRTL